MKFRIRKPRLRISNKGKVSLSGGGFSVGGKGSHINVSESGVSTTIGGKGMNCGFVALLVVGAGVAALAGIASWILA